MDSTRAVPGTDLSVDIGHEGGRQDMKALKGGSAAPNVAAPFSAPNTGAPARDLANATDASSPTSGYLSPNPPADFSWVQSLAEAGWLCGARV